LRILFITSTRIGDAVLSTGLLGHLLETHPGAAATVVCGPLPAPLFSAFPGVAEVIPMTKRHLDAHWVGLWRRTVGTRWDLLVDLRNSPVRWLLAARRRLVFRGGIPGQHKVEALGALAGPGKPPAPRLAVPPADAARAKALIPPGGPVLAVGPTANWPNKEWAADRFAALIAQLTGPGGALAGARIALFAGPGERERALAAVSGVASGRLIDLAGRTPLTLAAGCLARADLYVGNDSGLMHIAAAAGCPTLGLFGPSRDELYAPWGPRAAVVRTAESFEALLAREGGAWTRVSRGGMDGLTVAAAVAAATSLLARTEGDALARRAAP
jgi:lipopolysaccharide export system permease protein